MKKLTKIIMKKKINYKNLIVNPENYRFDSVDTQKQAIELMLEIKGDEVYSLAKHILENGLDLTKDFRVVEKSKDNYLILDGNRRTTAIKCLHDTSIIKNNVLKKKFDKLKIDTPKLPKNIQCFVYSSEQDASKWIKLDHGGKNKGIGQDSWGSPEIQRFGYKFEGKISPAMQVVKMIEDETGVRINTNKLKISTVDRIFSNPESRSYLGIDMKHQKVIITGEKIESIKCLNELFNTIIKDDIKVDKVYTKDKSIDFMKTLFGDKPKSKNSNPASTISIKENEQEGSYDDKNCNNFGIGPTNSKNERSDRVPIGLFSKSKIPFKLGNRQLQKLYTELSEPGILNYPNATHDLLRSFLECSLIAYLKHDNIKKYEDCLQDKHKTQKNITLTDMLDYLSKPKITIIADENVKRTVKQLISDKDKLYSVERMNLVNHNESWFSEKEEVKEAWEKIELLFKIILNP